jgi:outer membrane protein OmpA-like peptidoglycan-associated protein
MKIHRVCPVFPAHWVVLLLLGVVLSMGMGASVVHAQSATLPTVDEVVGKLGAVRDGAGTQNAVPQKKARKTRGIEFVDDADKTDADGGGSDTGGPAATDRVALVAASVPAQGAASGYSETRIQFEFNSDRLTDFARKVLDVFGAAIQSPSLKESGFIIEGHTDGVGSEAYNLELSRKRAEAVVRYLTDVRGISMDRLAARGKGKRELVNKSDPTAAENRRVVWLAMR